VLLTVDVGNTNIVLGLFDGPKLFASYRLRTDARVTADELAMLFRALLANHSDFVSPAMMYWTRSGDLIIMVVLVIFWLITKVV